MSNMPCLNFLEPLTAPEGLPLKAYAEITPLQASEILTGRNESNRKINILEARRLKKDMLAGEWRTNGDTICLDSEGQLVDGQHRLQAIVESSQSQVVLCVVGVNRDETLCTKDSGKNRSPADYLAMATDCESKDAAAAVTACSMLARWEATGGRAVIVGPANKLTTRGAAEYYMEHEAELSRGINWANEVPSKDRLLTKAQLVFVSSLILSDSAERGAIYLNQALRGLELEGNTVAHIVNSRLHQWKLDQRAHKSTSSPAQRILTVLNGWAVFRSGAKCPPKTKVIWNEGREDYPSIPFGSYSG